MSAFVSSTISGNARYGVNLAGATNTAVQGNVIGLNAAGTAKIANAIRAGSWVATTMATVALAKTSGCPIHETTAAKRRAKLDISGLSSDFDIER